MNEFIIIKHRLARGLAENKQQMEKVKDQQQIVNFRMGRKFKIYVQGDESILKDDEDIRMGSIHIAYTQACTS